jgi:BirA family biotin operon repressor/biotin-[acetyl-CoA-carboxylase] ligase
MVNRKQSTSTRAHILTILRSSELPVSGESMAASLSVSRVAVWKAIKALVDAGYGITASATGYTLTDDIPDCLEPWEFGQDESLIAYFPETDSTMNRARDAALAACPDGFVVIADAQTSGRGTGGKRWDSVPGGLFFTMITRPRLESPWAHRQVLAAQCALVRAIRAVSGAVVFPRWPNDLFAVTDSGSGKVGGILCEALISGNRAEYLNVGIGINTGSGSPARGYATVDLGRKALLEAFRREFTPTRYAAESLVSEWNALCPEVNREIAFTLKAAPYESPETKHPEMTGIFRGVDVRGYALIETSYGTHYGIDSAVERDTQVECYAPGELSMVYKGRKA